MPINFSQPAPFDARLLAEYGGRQSADRDAEIRLRQAQLRTQQLGIGLETANRAAAVDAGVYERQDRAQEFAALQRPSERDLFFAHQQMVMQRAQQAEAVERAQLAAWVHQQDMTYQETVRLRRDEAAVGHINADNDLSPAEKLEYVRELRTGIDSRKKRLQDTQQRMMDAKAAEDKAQAEHLARADQAAAKIDSMSFEDRTRWVVDPGTEAELARQVVSEWHAAGLPQGLQPPPAEVKAEVVRRAAKMGLAVPWHLDTRKGWVQGELPGAGKKAAEKEDRYELTPKDYLAARAAIVAEVDRRIKDGTLAPGDRGQAIADELAGAELPPGVGHLTRKQGGGQGAIPAAPAGQAATGGKGSDAPQAKPLGFTPFSPTNADEVRAPEQRAVVEAAQEDGRRIDASAAPPEAKKAALHANHLRMVLVATRGGKSKLDEKDRAFYDRLTQIIRDAVSAQPEPPAPGPARPPAVAAAGGGAAVGLPGRR